MKVLIQKDLLDIAFYTSLFVQITNITPAKIEVKDNIIFICLNGSLSNKNIEKIKSYFSSYGLKFEDT